MNLIDKSVLGFINNVLIKNVMEKNYISIGENIQHVAELMYNNIPDNKRISYGSYYVTKTLGTRLFEILETSEIKYFEIMCNVLEQSKNRHTQGVSLQVISYYGLEHLYEVLPVFKSAAANDHWEVREFAAGFINKLTKKHPKEVKEFYLSIVNSDDSNVRRFVSESLRPVSENRWLFKDSEYSLSIIRHLFKEKSPYPRTSVGNLLSDWSKKNPELVFDIVKNLVESNDKNSYWIAYRACRNLVKKEPKKVMDLLKTDEYKYKKNIYKRDL